LSRWINLDQVTESLISMTEERHEIRIAPHARDIQKKESQLAVRCG